MKDVAFAASEPWKHIGAREKERYEMMAKKHKAQDKISGERYSSQGRPLSEVKREEEEVQRKEDGKKREIVKIIDGAVANDSKDFWGFSGLETCI